MLQPMRTGGYQDNIQVMRKQLKILMLVGLQHPVYQLSSFPTTGVNNIRYTEINLSYSKTCVKLPLSKRSKLVFKTNYRLMQVKSIAECSNWSILQYF